MAIALLALGLLVLHRGYLTAPSPLWDEKMYLDATELWLAGGSPYEHQFFNYPPPLVLLIASAVRGGRVEELLLSWRVLNLAAVVGLAWLAASRTGWRLRWRVAAALAVGASPIIGQAMRFGNLSPLVALAALAALALERRRPWPAAILLGASLAVKPVALGAAAFLGGHRLLTGPRRPLPVAALAWPGVLLAVVAPGAALVPAMLERMSRAYFDPHHLSLKRALAGLGVEVSSVWIAAAVVAGALWLARRRPLEPAEMVAAAPAVALLALPVVWAHTFALTVPLQLDSLARLGRRIDGKRRRRALQASDLGEVVGILAALAVIHGSASAMLVNHWPRGVQLLVCLAPTLAPALLVGYLSATSERGLGVPAR